MPAGFGDITLGTSGVVAPSTKQEVPGVFTATLDLDRTVFHTNYNDFSKILDDHKGLIVQESVPGYCSEPGNCSSTADMLSQSAFVVLSRTEAGGMHHCTTVHHTSALENTDGVHHPLL